MIRAALLLWVLIAGPALAQDALRVGRAVPFLMQQRNDALNDDALCHGDINALQGQVAELQKQLADAKAEVERLKAPPTPEPG